VLIQFSAGEEFLAVVEKVRSLASHRLPPNATFEQVFALVMDDFVKREDPAVRHEGREARTAGSRPATKPVSSNSHDDAGPARHILRRVRDQVFARDRGRCTYAGIDGRRCGSTHLLQIDHIRPVARGGGNEAGNLRLLCAQHNRLEAERLMGRSGPAGASRT
jgi:hypothetical protein